MLKEFRTTKKVPRLLLAHAEEYLEAIPEVQVLWPDRTYSAVYDLSLSGLSVDAHAQLGGLRLDQSLELRLKIPGQEETTPFKVRVVRLKANVAGFVFENTGFDNRLVLDQITKDQIVSDSMKEIPLSQLPEQLRGSLWLHGAFDTNVIVNFRAGRLEVEHAVVESDNTVWIYDNGAISVQKSAGTADESAAYFQASELLNPGPRKVSMGASWMDRVIRVLDQVNERRGGDLAGLLILLRSQRAQ